MPRSKQTEASTPTTSKPKTEVAAVDSPKEAPPSKVVYLDSKKGSLSFPGFIIKFPPSEWNPRHKSWLAEIDSLFAIIPAEFFAETLKWDVDRQTEVVSLAKEGKIPELLNYVTEQLNDGTSDSLVYGLISKDSDFVLPLLQSLLAFQTLRHVGEDLAADSKALALAVESKDTLPDQLEMAVRFFEDLRGAIQVEYRAGVNLAPIGSGREKPLVVASATKTDGAEILDGNTRTRLLLKVIELIKQRKPVDIDVLVKVDPVVYREISNLSIFDRFAVVTTENGSNPLGRMAQFLVLADLFEKTATSIPLKEFLKTLKNSGVKIDGREFSPAHRSILKRWIELPNNFKEFILNLSVRDINAALNLFSGVTSQLEELLNSVDAEVFKKALNQTPEDFINTWSQEVDLKQTFVESGLAVDFDSFTTHQVPELVMAFSSVVVAGLLKKEPNLFPSELENLNSELKPVEVSESDTIESGETPKWDFSFNPEKPVPIIELKKGLNAEGKLVFQSLEKGNVPVVTNPVDTETLSKLMAKLQDSIYDSGITSVNSATLAPTITSVIKAQETLAQAVETLNEYFTALELATKVEEEGEVEEADEVPF